MKQGKCFKLIGDQKTIDIALQKLEQLFKDPNNHMVVCHLTDAPKSSDIPQIKHYVK